MEQPKTTTEQQEPMPIRKLMQKISNVENLLNTRKLLVEIIAGRIDVNDTDTLAAIDERLKELGYQE